VFVDRAKEGTRQQVPREPNRAYLAGTFFVLIGILGMIIARVATAELHHGAWVSAVPASVAKQWESPDAVVVPGATIGHTRGGTIELFLEHTVTFTDRRPRFHITNISLPPPVFSVVSAATT